MQAKNQRTEKYGISLSDDMSKETERDHKILYPVFGALKSLRQTDDQQMITALRLRDD